MKILNIFSACNETVETEMGLAGKCNSGATALSRYQFVFRREKSQTYLSDAEISNR